ncbi:unnamed protein product, partial [Polarella glacialis]
SGRLQGIQAADFLSRSGLSREVLKEIWRLADSASEGSLDADGFSIALRLVAHAQACGDVSQELLHQEPPGPPRLEGPPLYTMPSSTPSASSRARSPLPGEDRGAPTPRDLRKYGRLFCRSAGSSQHARLTAAEAQQLLGASGLEGDQLAAIWDFSDVDRDECLSWHEFVVAMHFI